MATFRTIRPARRAALLTSAIALPVLLGACGSESGGGTTVPSTTTPSTVAPSTAVPSTVDTRCRTSELRASVGRLDPGAGQKNFPVVLTNDSARTCTLRGYPGVAFVDAAGKQLGRRPETLRRQADDGPSGPRRQCLGGPELREPGAQRGRDGDSGRAAGDPAGRAGPAEGDVGEGRGPGRREQVVGVPDGLRSRHRTLTRSRGRRAGPAFMEGYRHPCPGGPNSERRVRRGPVHRPARRRPGLRRRPPVRAAGGGRGGSRRRARGRHRRDLAGARVGGGRAARAGGRLPRGGAGAGPLLRCRGALPGLRRVDGPVGEEPARAAADLGLRARLGDHGRTEPGRDHRAAHAGGVRHGRPARASGPSRTPTPARICRTRRRCCCRSPTSPTCWRSARAA